VIVTLRFSNQLVAELVQSFWAALQAGEFLTDAAGPGRYSPLAWPGLGA
jgi:transposase, IS30 family